ncbi:hypothetical protein NUW54_g10415 [Trametes sanguinea]|uniref:Uncharacterized protein n=1 Tax=Trametes sanguinea TaxID=158606 RepID=A0ACC1P1H7_9APHY|nr:hypothetical protein NUW54_g10415 [Trametes sanguinea]
MARRFVYTRGGVAVPPISLYEDLVYEGWEQLVAENREHTFWSILHTEPTSAARLRLLLPYITSVEFTAHKTMYRLQGCDPSGRLLLDLGRDLARIFAGGNAVTDLTICTDFDAESDQNIGVEELDGVFTCFSTLKRLHLDGRGCLEAVWEALTPIQEPGQAADVPCQDLQAIIVSGLHFYGHDEFFNIILPMLRQRDACGRRLPRLVLYLMPAVSEEEEAEAKNQRLQETYMPQLRKYVGDVQYAGVDWEEFDPDDDAGI